MYVRLVRAQDASNCWITEARNEFKLATASGPAGTIVSFASRLQQPATTTFLSQIDPSRKANFMLRSRRASASLLAHYVFRPAPPSHIIARLSLLFLLLFFSSSFFFFHSQLFLVLLPPSCTLYLVLVFFIIFSLFCLVLFLFLFVFFFGVRLSGSTVNRAFIIIASRRGWCRRGRATGPRKGHWPADSST